MALLKIASGTSARIFISLNNFINVDKTKLSHEIVPVNVYSLLANRLDKEGSKVLVNALFVSIEWFVMSCKENSAGISLRFHLTHIFFFS